MTSSRTADPPVESAPAAPPPAIAMEPVEHHDPLGRRDYISRQHLERYRFALQHVAPGMRVLDVACGAGYGSAMLAAHGCVVTGGDYDPRTVALAALRFAGPRFTIANALDLPFADASFDAVVTFETIEHVVDGHRFAAEMRRVLRPGGTLVCSTPNIAFTAHPDYHVREYAPDDFYALVERHFGTVEKWAQYFRPRDRLRDLACWHLKPHVLRLADAVNARPLLRRLAGRPADPAAAGPGDPAARVRAVLAANADPTHRVVRWRGERRLRIMIAVARREAES